MSSDKICDFNIPELAGEEIVSELFSDAHLSLKHFFKISGPVWSF